MRKPASLRAAIAAVFPALARDPDRLRIWIDSGRIAARYGPTPGWEYRYKLSVLLLDWKDSTDPLLLAIVGWLQTEQPDLLQNHERGNEAVKFRADILDDATIDLQFDLELTETVGCTPREGGGFDLINQPEPSPEDPGFLGLDPIVPLSSIWIDGEQLVPAPDLDPPLGD